MPEIFLFYFSVFVIGTFFGSFLNVIIDRLPAGKSFIYPSSHCPNCKHKLGALDLIPIFSFFLLKRRCRYCRSKISWYYPMIEAITGVVFTVTIFVVLGLGVNVFLQQMSHLWMILYLLIIISSMIVVFFIDLKYGIIPFKIVIFTLAIITLRYIFLEIQSPGYIFGFLVSGVIVFFLFLALFLLTKGRAIGFGDVFFSLLMGYLLGFPQIVLAVYIAFLSGAFVSVLLVLNNKKRLHGGTIPFGPFLVSGTLISLFWGQFLMERILIYLHVY